MKESFSIKFTLLPIKDSAQEGKIYIRIIVNRKKAEIATEHVVKLSQWDEASQRVKKNPALNEELVYIENKIREIKRQLVYNDKPVTAKIIKDIFTGATKVNRYLVEYFEEYIEKIDALPNEYSKGTVQRHKTALLHLREFLQFSKKSDVLLKEVDFRFITDFDQHMLTKINKQYQKPMTRNTANKHHSWGKKILGIAVKEELLDKNPYQYFPLKNETTSRDFLTEEEIALLQSHALGDNYSLQTVRDIFMFSVYTGLRYSDAMSLKIGTHVRKDAEGVWRLNLKAQEKTNEPVRMPLLPQAVKIIERYDNEERRVTGFVLPRFSNQKINAYLKVIADLVGIDKKLTHHIGRHTFATTVTLENEVPLEVVSKMLGHTDIKTTTIYAKITNKYLAKCTEDLERKLAEKEKSSI